jgi:HTH-type transcriptional regulator/antitoxin HipB
MRRGISLDELKDKHLGKTGTQRRDQYEYELSVEILSEQIKQLRKERKMTQVALGLLIGVQRSQISKLENNTKNVTIGTLLKVFNALSATIHFSVEKSNSTLS